MSPFQNPPATAIPPPAALFARDKNCTTLNQRFVFLVDMIIAPACAFVNCYFYKIFRHGTGADAGWCLHWVYACGMISAERISYHMHISPLRGDAHKFHGVPSETAHANHTINVLRLWYDKHKTSASACLHAAGSREKLEAAVKNKVNFFAAQCV